MHDVNVTFALKVGSETLREEDMPPAADLGEALAGGTLHGALIVEIDGEEVLGEDTWDQLDTVLESFIEAVVEVREGHEAEVSFPETRTEVVLMPSAGSAEEGDVVLEVERTRVYVDSTALEDALFDCASRLLARFVEAGEALTPPLQRLAEAIEAREE